MVPDLRFEIRELLVAGEKAVVRGRAIGTPAGELFGQPHTGRSFQIMTIDILTLRAGRITSAYHLENWLGALQQLRG
jgi:predicted ester cyclase